MIEATLPLKVSPGVNKHDLGVDFSVNVRTKIQIKKLDSTDKIKFEISVDILGADEVQVVNTKPGSKTNYEPMKKFMIKQLEQLTTITKVFSFEKWCLNTSISNDKNYCISLGDKLYKEKGECDYQLDNYNAGDTMNAPSAKNFKYCIDDIQLEVKENFIENYVIFNSS